MFDPKTKKYPYTEYTDQHYLVIKHNNGMKFDKNYPFVDNSKSFKSKRFWLRVFLYTLVYPLTIIRQGLKVKGRKNLKKYKDVINNGIISCCNHIHIWDFLGISYAIRPKKPRYLVWPQNIRGSLGGALRAMGGIPVPDDNKVSSQFKFSKEVGQYLEEKNWLHIYPEGSMWEYYKPIRPFKRGLGIFACKYDRPILPMAYSYRKPGWIRRKIFKQIACLTLTIGEPIYINKELDKEEQIQDILTRSHAAVCSLAGFDQKDNIYPPIFDNTKKVNYY